MLCRLSLFFCFIVSLGILSGCQRTLPVQGEWEPVAEHLQFPEGPAWDYEQTLYVSNCYGDWITRVSEGEVDTFLMAGDSTFVTTNGLTVGPGGNLYACDFGQGALLRFAPDGKSTLVAAGFEGMPFNRPNDLAFWEDSRLYISDPKGYGPDKMDGRLFAIDITSGQVQLVVDSLTYPNGLAFSPRDGKLYLSESARHRVIRFEVGESGDLSRPDVFVELPGGDPDGLAFDTAGNLYVAHFGSGTVYVVSPEGVILQEVSAPGKKPSNLEFGGTDLRTLYLTEDETNGVYKTRTTIQGSSLQQMF